VGNPRFGFVALPGPVFAPACPSCPKKNPDVPELARARAEGRGRLVALLTLDEGQPRLQQGQSETRPLFDAVDTLRDTLAIFIELIAGIQVNAGRDAHRGERRLRHGNRLRRLPVKGAPFSDAHEAVARAVRFGKRPSWVWSSAARGNAPFLP